VDFAQPMQRLKYSFLFILTFVAANQIQAERPSGTTALFFVERERGGEPFQTRMLVTSRYLRIDEGNDTGDYILFDRAHPAIYSVNYLDKTILVISPSKIDLAPPKVFKHEVQVDKDSYPDVGGKKVIHYQLLTNRARCYDVFAAMGLLPEAAQALREYHQALAGEQAATMKNTPREMQSPCDLANHIFLPARHLGQGFPVRQEDMAGNLRQLINYDEHYRSDQTLFQLPEGFTRYRAQEMRGG
jgi:hypothetical protein